MSHKPKTSVSGIAITENGERLIPSSVRADGSVRKEIRVRQGFKPAEDIERYKSRNAEAWKNRGKAGGVPGAEFVNKPSHPAAKKKELAPAPPAKENPPPKPQEQAPPAVPANPEMDKEKEAKKLSKKLRQARDLQKKKSEGGALLPEQFEKVIRINELIRQLDALGFDQEGAKKQ